MGQSQSHTKDVVVLDVNELGLEGLMAEIYDTRDDDNATYIKYINSSLDSSGADWAEQSDLSGGGIKQYVDHRISQSSINYAEDRLIKTGSRIERRSKHLTVDTIQNTTVKIHPVPRAYSDWTDSDSAQPPDSYQIIVEESGKNIFETTLNCRTELNLETHPVVE